MTIKELKLFIKDLPDNANLVMVVSDYSKPGWSVRAHVSTVVYAPVGTQRYFAPSRGEYVDIATGAEISLHGDAR